jgi:hypothetical protein
MIGFVNQDYLYGRASQATGRCQASKASTNDYDLSGLVHSVILLKPDLTNRFHDLNE